MCQFIINLSFPKKLSLNFTEKRFSETDLNAYKRSFKLAAISEKGLNGLHEVTKNMKTTKEISTPSKFNDNVKAMLTSYLCIVHWEPY